MSNTTIDGLKVRTSNKRPVVSAPRKSSGMLDITTRRVVRPPAEELLPAVVEKNTATAEDATSFLEPVESFPYGDSEVILAKQNADEWSDLLDEMNKKGPEGPKKVASAKKPEKNTLTKDSLDEIDGFDSWSEALAEWKDAELALESDSEEEPKKAKRPIKTRKKRSIRKKVAVAIVALLVVGGAALYLWGDSLISKLTGGNSGLWSTLSAMVSNAVPFETDADGRTNVLIFGTEGYDMDGSTVNGEHAGSQLTDSIMVASFDQKTKDVALISLPRDLKVPKACMAGKINEVFTCHNQNGADERAGAEAMMEQVGEILGIEFQYYAHVNWASLVDIVDTIGGITVTLDEDINDYSFTKAVAQAGVPIQVDGEQALGLARARHGTQGGDFTRGNTQQKIVTGVLEKIVKNGVGVTEALGLLNILGDNLRTNFSADNIKAGVQMVSGFDINQIRQLPLVDYDNNVFYVTTATINDISYVVPSAGTNDYSQIRAYVRSMLSSDPVQREGATIAVYNATGEYGVAGAERDRLTDDGYSVIEVADAPGVCEERYCVYTTSDKAGTREALAARYGVTVADGAPEGVYTDADFIVIVGQAE